LIDKNVGSFEPGELYEFCRLPGYDAYYTPDFLEKVGRREFLTSGGAFKFPPSYKFLALVLEPQAIFFDESKVVLKVLFGEEVTYVLLGAIVPDFTPTRTSDYYFSRSVLAERLKPNDKQ
jgi:hypothetical protein